MARWVKSKNSMRIFKQTATPAVVDGLAVGDIWVDTNSGAIEKVCTNTSPVTFAQNSNSVSGTLGTATNDSAAAGYVGEILSADLLVASQITLTTATATNVVSVSLTAGDWLVWGIPVFFGTAATTTIGREFGWCSTTSASLPSVGKDYNAISFPAANAPAYVQALAMSTTPKEFKLASTTTVYLSVYSDFAASTLKVHGSIYGLRIR